MKLCRFELISSPSRARSGIVYGSKVYETDGANAAGIHEWSDVRLLAPVGQPPSVRLFVQADPELVWEEGEYSRVGAFEYLNPSALIGPGLTIPFPEWSKSLRASPCLAAVIAGQGRGVSSDQADDLVLGLCLACSFQTMDEGGRARDVGCAIGPAVTTPDELDDAVTVDERGRRYRFGLSLKINAAEVGSYDLSAWPHSMAEYISHASESCSMEQGDVLAVVLGVSEQQIEKGDQVQVVSDKLGAITVRIG